MSFQYDQYLANHRANVKRGFDWLCENLSDVTNDISDAAWQIEFAHDKSKDEEDEYIFMETTGLIKSSRIIKKHGLHTFIETHITGSIGYLFMMIWKMEN
jgi:hypothetical protein